jgi:hypothetical protein
MDLKFPASLQRGEQKIGLSERLSAREGDAAAGLVEKRKIPGDGPDEVGYADPPGGTFARLGRTSLYAAAAMSAAGMIGRYGMRAGCESPGRTDGDTSPAADAAFGPVDFAWQMLPVFGVVAPPAGKRAAFHEDGRADPGTVMRRKADDAENGSEKRTAVRCCSVFDGFQYSDGD